MDKQQGLGVADSPQRIEALEHAVQEFVAAVSNQEVQRLKKAKAYADLKALMTENNLDEYQCFDTPKLVHLKARDAEIKVDDKPTA